MTRYAYEHRQNDISMYVCIVTKRETKNKSQMASKLKIILLGAFKFLCKILQILKKKSCFKIGPYNICDGIPLHEFTCI